MPFADYDCEICEKATDHVAPVVVKGRRLMACLNCETDAMRQLPSVLHDHSEWLGQFTSGGEAKARRSR
jgi:hypothetical protein